MLTVTSSMVCTLAGALNIHIMTAFLFNFYVWDYKFWFQLRRFICFAISRAFCLSNQTWRKKGTDCWSQTRRPCSHGGPKGIQSQG